MDAEVINWKRLVFVQYGITLYVRYWPKDFVVEYKSKFGNLRYCSPHIPAACPKIYTEESVVAQCMKLWPDFIKAEKYISDHKDVMPEHITDDRIREIIKDYITEMYGKLKKENNAVV